MLAVLLILAGDSYPGISGRPILAGRACNHLSWSSSTRWAMESCLWPIKLSSACRLLQQQFRLIIVTELQLLALISALSRQ